MAYNYSVYSARHGDVCFVRYIDNISPNDGKIMELKDEERTRCEVWSRVMGYHRPVDQWNPGKQSEHRERLHFAESAMQKEFTGDESFIHLEQ